MGPIIGVKGLKNFLTLVECVNLLKALPRLAYLIAVPVVFFLMGLMPEGKRLSGAY